MKVLFQVPKKEKEREDAFSYGGFAFAKETLNLIDNFERSKKILENDDILKNCPFCKNMIENEMHAILFCPFYFNLRGKFLDKKL